MLSQRSMPCWMTFRNSGPSRRALWRPLSQCTHTRSAATAPGSALLACYRMRLKQHLSLCAMATATWLWSLSPGSLITRCRPWCFGHERMHLWLSALPRMGTLGIVRDILAGASHSTVLWSHAHPVWMGRGHAWHLLLPWPVPSHVMCRRQASKACNAAGSTANYNTSQQQPWHVGA